MRAVFLASAAGVLAGCQLAALEESQIEGRTAYIGGQIWTGEGFVAAPLVVEGHRFIDVEPGSAAEIVDLAGGYVLPPFCDAHTHEIQSSWELEPSIAAVRDAGVAYIRVMTSVPDYTDEIEPRLFQADGVDAVFAGAPVTGPGGHPIALYHRFHGYGAYPDLTLEELDGFAYFALDSEAALEAAWPSILARSGPMVKVMVEDSANYDARVGRGAYFGLTGLDPDLLQPLVERAHAAGRLVAAHVSTVEDFRVAIAAGVDEIAHLPGQRSVQILTAEDARAAAEAGVVVVTTAALADRTADRDPALYQDLRAAQAENLRVLRDAGVEVVLGTDGHTDIQGEATYVDGLGVFAPDELIRMMSTDCARFAFPDRQIGELAPGFEASFVVLEDDPLADVAATRSVTLLVKAPYAPATE